MTANSGIRQCNGQISNRALVVIVLVIILIGAVFLALRPKPEPEPIPAPASPLETVEPAQSKEERGDSAREIIVALEAEPEGTKYAKGYAQAQELRQAGRLADAQLLYFFAARGGYAPAAFDLATFYDPNHFAAGASLMDEPDPFQAYKWYRLAQEAGNAVADRRLAELRTWAEKAASSGNIDAEQLLIQWE
jgi:TPR repeat protein